MYQPEKEGRLCDRIKMQTKVQEGIQNSCRCEEEVFS
jgi:hypothetical protein